MYEVVFTVDGRFCPAMGFKKSRLFFDVFQYAAECLNALDSGFHFAEALLYQDGKVRFRFGVWKVE